MQYAYAPSIRELNNHVRMTHATSQHCHWLYMADTWQLIHAQLMRVFNMRLVTVPSTPD